MPDPEPIFPVVGDLLKNVFGHYRWPYHLQSRLLEIADDTEFSIQNASLFSFRQIGPAGELVPWGCAPAWSELVIYEIGDQVTGSDRNLYRAISQTKAMNPVGNDGGDWALSTTGGGAKIVANGTAGQAATPDYAGQWIIATDGALGLSKSTSAGHMGDAIIWITDQHYFKEINTRYTGTAGKATVGELIINVAPAGSVTPSGVSGFVDNAITVNNLSGGFAAAAFRKDGGTTDCEWAMGAGQVADNTSDFRGGYISGYNRAGVTLAPPPLIISQHQGPAANLHRRIWIDGGTGTDNSITGYGWTAAVGGGDDVREGPVGWHIHASGRVGIGTKIVSAADALTIAGTVRIGGYTGPQWLSGSASPEASVTAPVGSLYSRTTGGSATTLYVKESGAGNTGWVGK